MNHIDLFSGIGGFALAAHWAGFQTEVFCERDEFCQKVLHKHWPNTPIINVFSDSKEPDIRIGRFRSEENGDLLEVGGELNSSIIGASGDSSYRHAPNPPIDVCPHCKRPLLSIVGRYGFCKEHHEVVQMRSAISNEYEKTDWSAA